MVTSVAWGLPGFTWSCPEPSGKQGSNMTDMQVPHHRHSPFFLAGLPLLRLVMGMGAMALSVSLLKYFWLRLRARALRPAALPLLAASAAITAAMTSSRTFCTAALYSDCCS